MMPTKTLEKFRATPVPVELAVEVRDGLRRSRDLMNDDGEHWTQGEYKRMHPMQAGQFQWCAVGGIREMLRQAKVEAYAIVVLAERGIVAGDDRYIRSLRRDYADKLENVQEEWDYENQYYHPPIHPRPEALSIEEKAAVCEDVVTGWNDQPIRTWAEVRDAFTKAAAAVRGGASAVKDQ